MGTSPDGKCLMGADSGILCKQNRRPLREPGHQLLCLSSKKKGGQKYEKSSHGIFRTAGSKILLLTLLRTQHVGKANNPLPSEASESKESKIPYGDRHQAWVQNPHTTSRRVWS